MRAALIAWIVLAPAVALAAPKARPKKPAAAKPAPKPEEPAPKPDEPAPGAAVEDDGKSDGKKDAPAPAAMAAPEEPAAAPRPAGDAADVDSLRQEYLSLRDELFKSRARANAVASQLYSTRMQIKLTYTSGRYYSPVKASIRLDGAAVYENASGAIAGDDGIRFDGYVAPGRHLITFRVEATGKDDDTFTSVTETQVTVKAVADKDLIVSAKARDAGDIAYEWKRKEKGSYGLAVDVAVKTQARAEAKGAKK